MKSIAQTILDKFKHVDIVAERQSQSDIDNVFNIRTLVSEAYADFIDECDAHSHFNKTTTYDDKTTVIEFEDGSIITLKDAYAWAMFQY